MGGKKKFSSRLIMAQNPTRSLQDQRMSTYGWTHQRSMKTQEKQNTKLHCIECNSTRRYITRKNTYDCIQNIPRTKPKILFDPKKFFSQTQNLSQNPSRRNRRQLLVGNGSPHHVTTKTRKKTQDNAVFYQLYQDNAIYFVEKLRK